MIFFTQTSEEDETTLEASEEDETTLETSELTLSILSKASISCALAALFFLIKKYT